MSTAATGRIVARAWIVLTLAAAPAQLQGQGPDSASASAPSPPATGGWAGWAAVPHPWSTVVSITVVLPEGSAGDPDGLGGTAWLLGQVSAEAVRGRLGEEGVIRVEADVGRTRTVVRLLAVPDAWRGAYRALDRVLFDGEAAAPGLEEARDALRAVHAFEAGAPVREFEREMYRLLGEATGSWSRDPRGTPETLDRIGRADLIAFRRRAYRKEDAVISVTGAVDSREVSRLVTGEAADGDPGEPRSAIRSPPAAAPGPAWTEGRRVRLVRDVTSGWITAAYPLAPGLPRTAAEMLVHRVRAELVTEPPAPGLFSADATLEDLPGGVSILLVRVAVLPESVQRWETRIVEAVDRLSSSPLDPGFFRFYRRQFRNARLVSDALPEAEGLRSALDLQRSGRTRDLSLEIREMDAPALHRTLSSLGPPRILVFGPDLGR